MENKTYAKPMYKCGICDTVYESVAERSKCEQACVKKQIEEEKRAAEARKNAEREACYAEASAALENALVLVNKCVEKYGVFKYSGSMTDLERLNMDFFPIKLWHHFWQ